MADADTPQKRFSAYDLAMPFRGIRVIPTGTVDASERAAVLFLYSGITGGAGTPPTITASLPDAEVGRQYGYTLTATGDEPITWSATGIPLGMGLEGNVLRGVPVHAQTYTISVTATNSVGSDTQSLTLIVKATAGGKRRRRYFVEIDGQEFAVNSVAEAEVILAKAKDLAAEAAEKQVAAAAEKSLPRVRSLGRVQRADVSVAKPKITGSPELAEAITEARKAIQSIYDAKAAAAARALQRMIDAERDDEEVLLLWQ